MQDETKRRYLFVAIDRATRWVFVAIKANKSAASARAFLNALHKACPIRINKLLTDNGKEFTDRLFASRERKPSGNHEFDRLCQELGIEHRLTKPRTPRTNGMVERFNGRIADVLKTHRFSSSEDLEQTLLRYVALYNHQLPQSALKSKTPMQAMKDWHQSHPQLFNKRPYDRPGCDSSADKVDSTSAAAEPSGCVQLRARSSMSSLPGSVLPACAATQGSMTPIIGASSIGPVLCAFPLVWLDSSTSPAAPATSTPQAAMAMARLVLGFDGEKGMADNGGRTGIR